MFILFLLTLEITTHIFCLLVLNLYFLLFLTPFSSLPKWCCSIHIYKFYIYLKAPKTTLIVLQSQYSYRFTHTFTCPIVLHLFLHCRDSIWDHFPSDEGLSLVFLLVCVCWWHVLSGLFVVVYFTFILLMGQQSFFFF